MIQVKKMTLSEKINTEFINARKSQDQKTAQVLTMVRSAIKNKEIEKKDKLSDDEVLAIVGKEMKQRQDAIAQYEKGGRQDLADAEKAEIEILKKYLPAQLSEEKIEEIVNQVIDKVKASSPADMGKVMGQVMPQLKGKADGSVVQKIVRQKLSS